MFGEGGFRLSKISAQLARGKLQMAKAKQKLIEHEPLTVPIRTAATMLGIGRSTLYELLDAGEIETIKVGRRRLVLMSQARKLKVLEDENSRLKRLLADAMLDNAVLKEVASKNW
jgi:excisionase family DNA binding protein